MPKISTNASSLVFTTDLPMIDSNSTGVSSTVFSLFAYIRFSVAFSSMLTPATRAMLANAQLR